ncbi:MAG: glycerol-3-phosphate 1-O-acyltransferase PlsY [Christensenellales bacterium]|jgi:glycerol-3-phosphate acyltransferase PlsY
MLVLCAAIGYLLGCVSGGILTGHAFGKLDIRSVGSNSAGTTNVLRTLGWLPSLVTFVIDALKGFFAAMIGGALAGELGAMAGGLFAVLGHNWPAFYRFKGGKGMATSFGVILVIDPLIAMILLAVQITVLVLTKTMSMASLSTAGLYFVLTLLIRFGNWRGITFSFVLSCLAIYSHRANIKRLIEHKENALQFDKIKMLSEKIKRRNGK